MNVKVYNSFHNTTAVCRPKGVYLNSRQIRRLESILCCGDCCCGGWTGRFATVTAPGFENPIIMPYGRVLGTNEKVYEIVENPTAIY